MVKSWVYMSVKTGCYGNITLQFVMLLIKKVTKFGRYCSIKPHSVQNQVTNTFCTLQI